MKKNILYRTQYEIDRGNRWLSWALDLYFDKIPNMKSNQIITKFLDIAKKLNLSVDEIVDRIYTRKNNEYNLFDIDKYGIFFSYRSLASFNAYELGTYLVKRKDDPKLDIEEKYLFPDYALFYQSISDVLLKFEMPKYDKITNEKNNYEISLFHAITLNMSSKKDMKLIYKISKIMQKRDNVIYEMNYDVIEKFISSLLNIAFDKINNCLKKLDKLGNWKILHWLYNAKDDEDKPFTSFIHNKITLNYTLGDPSFIFQIENDNNYYILRWSDINNDKDVLLKPKILIKSEVDDMIKLYKTKILDLQINSQQVFLSNKTTREEKNEETPRKIKR